MLPLCLSANAAAGKADTFPNKKEWAIGPSIHPRCLTATAKGKKVKNQKVTSSEKGESPNRCADWTASSSRDKQTASSCCSKTNCRRGTRDRTRSKARWGRSANQNCNPHTYPNTTPTRSRSYHKGLTHWHPCHPPDESYHQSYPHTTPHPLQCYHRNRYNSSTEHHPEPHTPIPPPCLPACGLSATGRRRQPPAIGILIPAHGIPIDRVGGG